LPARALLCHCHVGASVPVFARPCRMIHAQVPAINATIATVQAIGASELAFDTATSLSTMKRPSRNRPIRAGQLASLALASEARRLPIPERYCERGSCTYRRSDRLARARAKPLREPTVRA
jgi:hypothetical protein